ncbi:MAG: hypothetical protein GY928_25855 [Colwellia sp.]|nr:hypothetical protein [Colwellia sp.]
MEKAYSIPCIICGKLVLQDSSTSVERQTCKRVMIDNMIMKSECEREKNRRYQSRYRKINPGRKAGHPLSLRNRSVALSSINHLVKFKAKKYKRQCLKCGKKFIGVGAYNRLCGSCQHENSRQSHLKIGV